MKRYILALDQGTTSSRAIVFDRTGKPLASSSKEFKQIYPQPGWVEHDAEEIWASQIEVAGKALEKADIESSQVAAIGITNQRETTVVWDRKTGKPIGNAIVWQCRRTAPICDDMKARGLEDAVREKTGLVIDAYFSGTKLKWILDNVDGARDRAKAGELAFGTIDTWLVYKLSGGNAHITDYSNASRTMLFNIHSLSWDEELLAELNIPTTMLPEVCPSSGHFADVNCGHKVLDGIPIAGDAGDQQAAMFGQACFHPGSIKNTYGTGCFLMLNTGETPVFSEHGILTTIACGADGSPVFAMEGSIFIAGAAVQWLRDGLGIIETAAETESLARSVPDTGGVYVVPAFSGLGAPYRDADARGAILGITRGTRCEHIVRATLESIAYQTADVMEALRSDSGGEIQQLRVDGGAAANNFLMQFQSDVLGTEVNRPVIRETTALGAAFLAGLAVGFWKDASQLEKCRETDAVFAPKSTPEGRAEALSGWRAAVRRVMHE